MSKLGLVAVPRQHVPRPAPGERVTIGVDLARNKWVYAVHWGGTVHRQLATPGELEHLQHLVGEFHPVHPVCVIYEACGFGYEVAWWAQAAGVEVLVIAASRVARVPGARVKTDRLDACTLATKGAARQLKGVAIPTRAQHEWRQVLRSYRQLRRDATRLQTRVRSVLQEHGRIGPAPASGWRVYERWLSTQPLPAPVAAAVHELCALRTAAHAGAARLYAPLLGLTTQPAYQPVVAALTTQAGVGPFTALRLQLEIGDPRRFHSAEAWVNGLGLTPSEYSTGDGPPRRGAIQKCGHTPLRAALVQCAWVAIRTDVGLRLVFDRIAPRAGKKRAIIAVTRRLARRLRARWLAALPTPPAAAV